MERGRRGDGENEGSMPSSPFPLIDPGAQQVNMQHLVKRKPQYKILKRVWKT